jgi:TRAP transporter 4TM/12TM fusion protein
VADEALNGPGDADTEDAPASVGIRIGRGLCALLTLASLAWAGDLYRSVGLDFLNNIMNEQFYAGMLAIGLPALFLCVPPTKGRALSGVAWFDLVAAVVSCATAVYVMVVYPRILDNFADNPPDAVVAGAILIGAIAEGLRRTAGNVLLFFLLFFLAFALVGHLIPGRLQGQFVPLDRLAIYIGLDSNGMLGLPMKVSTTIVIAFIFFGFLLEPSGGGRFFTDISTALMGRYRGGSSKIAIVASSLFGSISGSAVSNVVSTGVITIPLMRKSGYDAASAGAIEAVASTGGQLMPPMMGVAAFVMAELLNVEYGEVVLAALIPAILYYAALFIQVDLQAARDGIKPIERSLIPRVWPVLRSGGLFLIPFVVIVLCLFRWHLQPETAALYAALSLLPIGFLIGYQGDRLKLSEFVRVFSRTGRSSLEILMIGGAAGAIIGVLNISGLGFALTLELVGFAGGNLLVLLILAAIVCIILGMGMPTLGVYILLATLVAPAIVELGVPTLAAHLYVLYYGMMSMITPPVAIAAFAAASLANAPMMKTGWNAVKYGWSAYIVPFLFVFSPTLIMRGDVWHIALTCVTALAGVWMVSVAVMGYMARPIASAIRLAFAVGGLALLLPVDAFATAIWVNMAGLLAMAILLASEFVVSRRFATS